jgi:DNA-binding beta-propeller fold protein YncE
MFSKSPLLSEWAFLLFLLILFVSVSSAKSLYVNMINPDYVNSYKIQGSILQYQTTTNCRRSDPVGLALDPCSGYAFLTSEYSNYVDLFNAKSMIFEGTPTQTPAGAGIVFDKNRQKLYVVERTTQHLFVYLWKPELKTLFPEDIRELSGLGGQGAYGIDVDRQNRELYVTNAENTVHRYDINNWTHKGSIPITIDHNQAVGIAIDSKRHYMYTGSFTGGSGSHTYLVRTDINDPNNPMFSEKNAGAYVIGLAMDEDTGYLYVGTATKDFSEYNIRVYNTLTWPSDPWFCCEQRHKWSGGNVFRG